MVDDGGTRCRVCFVDDQLRADRPDRRFTGYVDQARNQILDVGWGAVFGVILPLGLLTQLRRPERRSAGIQQTAVVALALALAVLLVRNGGTWRSRAESPASRPSCSRCIRAPDVPRAGAALEPMMLALAAVAAVPSLSYAWRMARPSGAIFRPPMLCPTAYTTGP